MGIRLALLLIFTALSPGASADQIYRTVDENGNVVFTDVPPVNREGKPEGEKVTVEPANIYEPPVVAAPTAEAPVPTGGASSYYSELAVVDPVEDATIRDNAGELLIQAAITPPLRSDHRLLLVLDGAPTEVEAEDGVFELSNVDRGTHTVAAQVVNGDGIVQKESAPVTFHLLRYALPEVPATPAPTPNPAPRPATRR
jgi:Domain of unknown function (DUF4124)